MRDQKPGIALYELVSKSSEIKAKNETLEEVASEPTFFINGAEILLSSDTNDNIYFLTNKALIDSSVADQSFARLSSPSQVKLISLR